MGLHHLLIKSLWSPLWTKLYTKVDHSFSWSILGRADLDNCGGIKTIFWHNLHFAFKLFARWHNCAAGMPPIRKMTQHRFRDLRHLAWLFISPPSVTTGVECGQYMLNDRMTVDISKQRNSANSRQSVVQACYASNNATQISRKQDQLKLLSPI